MAEKLDLTTPIVETTDTFRVVKLIMDEETIGPPMPPVPPIEIPSSPPEPIPPPPPGMVVISVRDNSGKMQTFHYNGALAADMIKFINTGDFTTRSLHRRILEKLSANGQLPGTVTGTPETPSVGNPTGLE